MIDFAARERHHLDHLAAIWHALPAEARGTVYTAPSRAQQAVALGLANLAFVPETLTPPGDRPLLACSYGDLRRAGDRPVILGEHGAGQSYSNTHSSYVGGANRERVVLFLCPNEQAAVRNRDRYRKIPSVVVGMPVMDRLRRIPNPPPDPPVAAISFHWRCRVVPESDTTFDYYRLHLGHTKKALEEAGLELIGHAHPRLAPEAKLVYSRHGVEFVPSFEDVIRRAHLYAVDNSSTLYQFAALERPVVVLNSPKYRPWVHHGLRFWDEANVGLNVNDPRDLATTLLLGLDDDPIVARERRASVARVVPFLGDSARRAASEILAFMGE